MKTNVRKRVRVVIAMIAMCSLLAGSTLGVFAAGDGAWKTSKSRYSFLTSSQTKTFKKAVKGLTGVSYEPVAVVAKQTVAGTNYVYLCKGTTVTKKPVSAWYFMTIYKDLNKKVSIGSIKKMKVSKSCMLLRSTKSWISSRHMTKVRMIPAMGTTTFSDRLLIMLKMLPLKAWGVLPTVDATSATRVLMLSNSPDRLLTIPPTSRPFNHSVILSHIKFKGHPS